MNTYIDQVRTKWGEDLVEMDKVPSELGWPKDFEKKWQKLRAAKHRDLMDFCGFSIDRPHQRSTKRYAIERAEQY